ncbi:MAG: hypothetical protein ACOYO1_19075 [Bacteroidales bacterium]
MIGLIIIVIIVVILFNSFSKFNSWTRRHESLLLQIESEISKTPQNFELHYKKAECLMNLQNYYLASKEYNNVIQNADKLIRFKDSIIKDSKFNLKFCKEPFPWSTSGPNDFSGSYLHYFFLNIFGNSNCISASNLN